MIPVRQSTAFECSIGPVLDADGVAVTDCVVADLKLKKTTGNFAALNGSATLTHVSAGTYDLVLTTSDTDTVGLATIAIDDTVNACAPVRLQVIEEAVYDALYAASANAFAGAAGSTTLGAGAITATVIADDAFTAAKFADDCFVAANFGDDCFVAANFGDDCFVAANFATGAFTADVFAADALVAATFATGAFTADAFAANALVAATFNADCFTAAKFAADVWTEAADAILARNVSNVETTMGEHTLGTIILLGLEADLDTTPGSLLILGTDGSTTRFTKTLTTDAAAEPITKIA